MERLAERLKELGPKKRKPLFQKVDPLFYVKEIQNIKREDRRVQRAIQESGDPDFKKHNIRTDDIADAGEYKKLYNGLAPDVEARELFLQGTGRIFLF